MNIFSPRFYGLAQVAFDHNFSQSLNLQQIYGAGIGLDDHEATQADLRPEGHHGNMSGRVSSMRRRPLDENLIGSTFCVRLYAQAAQRP